MPTQAKAAHDPNNWLRQGDAVIPAQVRPGQYSTCAGETLINAFTTGDSNWPSGPFPQGNAGPLNNFFQRIWYGKVRGARPTPCTCCMLSE